jgi:hypothetical protein
VRWLRFFAGTAGRDWTIPPIRSPDPVRSPRHDRGKPLARFLPRVVLGSRSYRVTRWR